MHVNSRLPPDQRSATLVLDKVKTAVVSLGVQLKLLDSDKATWEQLTTARSQAESLSKGDGLESTRRALTNATESLTRLGTTLFGLRGNEIAALDGRRAGLDQPAVFSKLAPLLEHARKHVATNDGDQCPLCEQKVDRQELLAEH